MKISTIWQYVLNYASAIALLAAGAWFIAKPHAEGLINQTVEQRFEFVETNVNNLATTQQTLVGEIGDLKDAIEAQTKASEKDADVQQQILKAIQKLEK